MADAFCPDCKSYTPLVYDHTSGDTICSECGLVLVSHPVNESPESDEPGHQKPDPVPVGGPSNALLPSQGLGSTIATPDGSSLKSHLQNRNGLGPDGPRVQAFKAMEEMAENLGLAGPIREQAKEMYKKADEEKMCGRQRNPKAVMAACLYLACQEEGYPRTFKEIYGVAEGARMKEIHKCMEILKRQLEVGTRNGVVQARDIARRYCSTLGLSHRAIRAVQEAVQKTENYDIRRNSTSILAAAIFMVTQLSENKMSLRGQLPYLFSFFFNNNILI